MADIEQTPPPSRKLDRLVAEKMGEELSWALLPAYSINIEAAWELVEKAGLSLLPTKGGRWFCGKFDLNQEYFDEETGVIDGHFNSRSFRVADTAPHAICLAFLALPDEVLK